MYSTLLPNGGKSIVRTARKKVGHELVTLTEYSALHLIFSQESCEIFSKIFKIKREFW
jgi:hypothetical protein